MTQNDKVFEAIRSHVEKYGKPPSMKKIMSMTKLPMKAISVSMVHLRVVGRISYIPRDYSTIQITSPTEKPVVEFDHETETYLAKRQTPKSRKRRDVVVHKPAKSNAKNNLAKAMITTVARSAARWSEPNDRPKMVIDVLAAIDAFDSKINDLIEQKKMLDEYILVFEKSEKSAISPKVKTMFLTVTQAAERAKVSRSTIERWRRRKKNALPIYRSGGRVLISREELDKFIAPKKDCVK